MNLGLLVVLGIFGGFALFFWLHFKFWVWFDNRREAKRKKEHPYLFELVRERNALGSKSCAWYNNEISPRKQKIDFIIKQEVYLPEEINTKKKKELEQLRSELYTALMEDARMEAELAGIRTKIADYVTNNNLKWAKERGWDSN